MWPFPPTARIAALISERSAAIGCAVTGPAFSKGGTGMTSPQRKSSSRKKKRARRHDAETTAARTTATGTSLPSMQLSKRSKVITKKGITKRVITKEDRDATQKKVRTLQNQFAGRVVTRKLSDNTVTRYRAASGAPAKRKASEEMGESGAVAWLNHRTGQNLTISRPKSAAPFARTFTNGVAWPDAVAFNGAGVADVVHWDGTMVHVVEAK